MRSTVISLFAGAFALACSGERLDVGSRSPSIDPGEGGSASTPEIGGLPDFKTLPSFPDPRACVTGDELPIVGTWDGYVEGATPGSYNDSFRLTIYGASAQAGVCGTIVYGKGTPPAPATDPDVAYPSADTGYGPYVMTAQGPNPGGPGIWGPMPGVAFTIVNGSVDGSRVRFGVAWSELWEGWCELQTAYDGFCLQNDAPERRFGPPDDCALLDSQRHQTPVDCGKYDLCLYSFVCECNTTECVASTGPYQGFDLSFDGDLADGSASDRTSGRARLFRVE
jgi:hypothetical protein